MEAKRIGRPPKADAVRKRKNQTFRIRNSTLALLTSAAEKNQSSISEEIEQRIEQSFLVQVQVEKIFGDIRRYVQLAVSNQAMDAAQASIAAVITSENDRECLKALAAAQTYEMRAEHYCIDTYKRDVVLRTEARDIAKAAMMSADPFLAAWHKEPDIGTEEDINKPGVELLVEPSISVEILDTTPANDELHERKPTPRRRAKT